MPWTSLSCSTGSRRKEHFPSLICSMACIGQKCPLAAAVARQWFGKCVLQKMALLLIIQLPCGGFASTLPVLCESYGHRVFNPMPRMHISIWCLLISYVCISWNCFLLDQPLAHICQDSLVWLFWIGSKVHTVQHPVSHSGQWAAQRSQVRMPGRLLLAFPHIYCPPLVRAIFASNSAGSHQTGVFTSPSFWALAEDARKWIRDLSGALSYDCMMLPCAEFDQCSSEASIVCWASAAATAMCFRATLCLKRTLQGSKLGEFCRPSVIYHWAMTRALGMAFLLSTTLCC